MKIKYCYGDILNTDIKYICHCVNSQGIMGSGIAKQIKAKYPKAYEVYKDRYNIKNKLPLGIIIGADCGSHTILNLVGQKNYGKNGRLYLDYIALRQGIKTINNNISESVAFPMIGCGLAGGNWQLVSEIIEEESTKFQPVVYQFDDNIPF